MVEEEFCYMEGASGMVEVLLARGSGGILRQGNCFITLYKVVYVAILDHFTKNMNRSLLLSTKATDLRVMEGGGMASLVPPPPGDPTCR
jgi:hypothetical protein